MSELYPGMEVTLARVGGERDPRGVEVRVAGNHVPAALLARLRRDARSARPLLMGLYVPGEHTLTSCVLRLILTLLLILMNVSDGAT